MCRVSGAEEEGQYLHLDSDEGREEEKRERKEVSLSMAVDHVPSQNAYTDELGGHDLDITGRASRGIPARQKHLLSSVWSSLFIILSASF